MNVVSRRKLRKDIKVLDNRKEYLKEKIKIGKGNSYNRAEYGALTRALDLMTGLLTQMEKQC